MLFCNFESILFFCLQEAELEARREQERMQEYRRQIIEQERQRLLKEHASKLLGFLPKVGVSLPRARTCLYVLHDLVTHLTKYKLSTIHSKQTPKKF